MSQYLLINRIQVQDANAVAGFTWGFPAITHFLGFTHNLSRKLQRHESYSDVHLLGCAVIAHQHQVRTYAYNQFLQSKNPPYQFGEQPKNKVGSPPIIEEGKMNMVVSLLIGCEGNIGNREDELLNWLDRVCKRQRLAGGTILQIGGIELITADDDKNQDGLRKLTRKLLPGFVLLDRSPYLEEHYNSLQKENADIELFDSWLDFIALKQKARPAFDLINRYLFKQAEDEAGQQLLAVWLKHLEEPYDQLAIPQALQSHFSSFSENTANKKLLEQWQNYCIPNEKTDAVWEYVKKPKPGFLVPIMVGYKAISQVYENKQVANTRDHETDVCFVEAVHSIGEWQAVHRIRDAEALERSLWHYDYQEHWYLCKQGMAAKRSEIDDKAPNDFS